MDSVFLVNVIEFWLVLIFSVWVFRRVASRGITVQSRRFALIMLPAVALTSAYMGISAQTQVLAFIEAWLTCLAGGLFFVALLSKPETSQPLEKENEHV